MLVLSRKKRESLRLILPDGREVVIQVTALNESRVRLGFEGPDDVIVLREEVYQDDAAQLRTQVAG